MPLDLNPFIFRAYDVRGKLGEAPVRMLFEQVAGPTGADGAPGVSCCGLRVVSVDGSTSAVPDSTRGSVSTASSGNPASGRFQSAGRTMMCNTAAIQLNVGLGDAARTFARW